MAELKIITVPNKKLREKAKKIANFNDELKRFAEQMVEKMRGSDGVGLAAPQLGRLERMIVVEFNPKEEEKKKNKADEKPFPLTILINPSITKFSKEKVIMEEGCLSLPDLLINVERPRDINVVAQNIKGERIKIRAKGLMARVIQHETDHLDGILFTDRTKLSGNLDSYKNLKAVFLGTPEFAVPALEVMVNSGLTIVAVITESDKPAGRKLELKAPEVKIKAEELGLSVMQPDNKAELTEIIKQFKPHYLVLAAYGKILPKELLDLIPYGAINIHPSLLPKYRGATPIQAAILNGEKETGVTIMRMNEKMDEGDIIAQEKIELNGFETAGELSEKLAKAGADLLIKSLPAYLGNQKMPEEQKGEASYTKLIKKEDGLINLDEPAEVIERKIRAYNPWPKAFIFLKNNKRLVIHKAHIEDDKLVLDLVQLEGKNPISWKDFQNNYHELMPKNLK